MNNMIVGNQGTVGDTAASLDQSAPLENYVTNGCFGGIAVALTAMIPLWTGTIWLGLRLFNYT